MKKRNITVEQKVNGWNKFIEYMIQDCNTDIRDYTTDMEDYADGIYLDLIGDMKYIIVNIKVLSNRIDILVDLYEEINDNYEGVNLRLYMRRLRHERDYMYEKLNYIDEFISPIGYDVINAMLNDAFGKEI